MTKTLNTPHVRTAHAYTLTPATVTVDVLQVRHTTSAARETLGWNVVELRDLRGNRLAVATGGGYDMLGAALARYLKAVWVTELVRYWATRADLPKCLRLGTDLTCYIDGTYGFEMLTRMAAQAGVEIAQVRHHKTGVVTALTITHVQAAA